jgi:nucleotide-binding universal stress UspA family protein
MIVMTTYGRGGAGIAGLGSVADRVARHATVPTLVIRGGERGVAPPVGRIVVPLDGSNLSELALPHAMDLADVLGVPVALVRVLDTAVLGEAARLGNYAATRYVEAIDTVRSAASAYLTRHEQTVRDRDIAVSSQLIEGSPANELLGAIREGDLVVMTTHGRSGFSRWLLGSVADKIVRYGAGPVLLVRPER